MPDNASWCSQCGAPLDTRQMQSQTQMQTQNPQQLQPMRELQTEPQPMHYPQPPRNNNNRPLVVAISAVAVLLLIAIILFIVYYFNVSDEKVNLEGAADSEWAMEEEDPWAKLDERTQQERQPVRETVRVSEQPAQPAVSWRPRTITATCYDSSGEYPIKVTFEENENGEVRNCKYTNINYGTKLGLNGVNTGSGYTFSGSASGTGVSVHFQDVGGGNFQGTLRVGDKELKLTGSLY